jgi:hypothetical protein
MVFGSVDNRIYHYRVLTLLAQVASTQISIVHLNPDSLRVKFLYILTSIFGYTVKFATMTADNALNWGAPQFFASHGSE